MTEPRIRVLRCSCGWETSGTFDEIVLATQEHGRRIHNMSATPDEVEAMLLPIDPPADHRAEPTDAQGGSA